MGAKKVNYGFADILNGHSKWKYVTVRCSVCGRIITGHGKMRKHQRMHQKLEVARY